MMQGKIIYIAGPMTGHADWNYPAFNDKARELRALGYEVRNPAETEIEGEPEWIDWMERAIAMMLPECNAIYMLPGWSKSNGARIEHMIAWRQGMEIMGAME